MDGTCIRSAPNQLLISCEPAVTCHSDQRWKTHHYDDRCAAMRFTGSTLEHLGYHVPQTTINRAESCMYEMQPKPAHQHPNRPIATELENLLVQKRESSAGHSAPRSLEKPHLNSLELKVEGWAEPHLNSLEARTAGRAELNAPRSLFELGKSTDSMVAKTAAAPVATGSLAAKMEAAAPVATGSLAVGGTAPVATGSLAAKMRHRPPVLLPQIPPILPEKPLYS